jgi:hypothetical protein
MAFVSLRACIKKFPHRVDNEIHNHNNNNNNNNNKHSLRSNTNGYGSKPRYTDSQNSDTTAPSDTELYHLQFSLQAARPEMFGYPLVCVCVRVCVYVCVYIYIQDHLNYTATRLRDGRPGSIPGRGREGILSLYSTPSRPALRPTQSPIQWEAEHSPRLHGVAMLLSRGTFTVLMVKF